MITAQKKRRIRECLSSLLETYTTAVSQIQSTISLLTDALELDDFSDLLRVTASVDRQSTKRPVADRATLAIVWKKRSCFLGNTLLFSFFERLNRTPNRFVSHFELLDDVWKGQREKSTIRGVVLRLRERLIQAGMQELADAIDGSTPGFYRLRLQ